MTQNRHDGMVLHDIGIPRLEAFIAVATEHSFTRGALSISLTQPTVSARVAALERDLGVALFERLGRDIRLTDAGNALLPHARRTVHAARDAAEAIRALRVGGGGSVLIGTAPTFGTYVLPDLLQRFDAAYPDVEITIRTGRSLEVSQMILDDVVQIGFERRLGHPEIAAITLYEDDIMLMASPAHAIAQRRRAPVSDIARESIVFFDTGSSYHALSHAVFRESEIAPRHALDVDSLEMAKHLVLRGLGLAFLPRVAVERELASGELVPIRIEGAEPISRSISVIYRRRRSMSDAALAFLELVKDAYGVGDD